MKFKIYSMTPNLNFHHPPSHLSITEDDYTKCMKDVQLPNMNVRVYEEKIVTLQRKLEDLLGDDEELRMKASRGEF